MSDRALHIPVLFDEVMSYIRRDDSVLLDCTLGYAGHALGFLRQNARSSLVACDQDAMAIAHAQKALSGYDATIYKCNYKDIFKHYNGEPDFVLADIGVSSVQLDLDERGFGMSSSVLDMRMDSEQGMSAREFLATCSSAQLEWVLSTYGQLPHARKLAARIMEYQGRIDSCARLRQIIGDQRLRGRNVLVATLVFQAIRIHINDELGVLRSFLDQIAARKWQRTRVLIISFHSLEDSIVKEYFRRWERDCICDSAAPRCVCGGGHRLGRALTRKPIVPDQEQIKRNSRSAPARLRVFEFGNV